MRCDFTAHCMASTLPGEYRGRPFSRPIILASPSALAAAVTVRHKRPRTISDSAINISSFIILMIIIKMIIIVHWSHKYIAHRMMTWTEMCFLSVSGSPRLISQHCLHDLCRYIHRRSRVEATNMYSDACRQHVIRVTVSMVTVSIYHFRRANCIDTLETTGNGSYSHACSVLAYSCSGSCSCVQSNLYGSVYILVDLRIVSARGHR